MTLKKRLAKLEKCIPKPAEKVLWHGLDSEELERWIIYLKEMVPRTWAPRPWQPWWYYYDTLPPSEQGWKYNNTPPRLCDLVWDELQPDEREDMENHVRKTMEAKSNAT